MVLASLLEEGLTQPQEEGLTQPLELHHMLRTVGSGALGYRKSQFNN